ncbi:unnamed protein product [Ostreobium quekettii]|uniref:Uncharacterized protein n=1 Tax=Ostreobium quekettii TaxID=121088 RepID=A0A8S1JBL2_9CHLO|nr:unnamed protein product [Ostreobium quekettii]
MLIGFHREPGRLGMGRQEATGDGAFGRGGFAILFMQRTGAGRGRGTTISSGCRMSGASTRRILWYGCSSAVDGQPAALHESTQEAWASWVWVVVRKFNSFRIIRLERR